MTRISAHQGGSEQAPPGTYEAYQGSVATGAEYVEFDIRRTGDHALVAYHDDRAGAAGAAGAAERAGAPGRAGAAGRLVSELGHAELSELAGYRVPLVEDVMALLAGRVIGHLDLKETGYEEEVIAMSLAILGSGQFIATTLEDASIAAIKRSFPQVRTALSLGRNLEGVPWRRWPAVRASELLPLRRIRSCGADWVAVNYKLAPFGVIGACQRHGIGVMVWTVDSDERLDQFLTDRQVDVLITNRPQHALRRRAELSG